MCDSSGFFMEISNNMLGCDFADDVTSDLSGQPVITGMTICIQVIARSLHLNVVILVDLRFCQTK